MKRFSILTRSLFLSYAREPQTLFWNLVFPLFLLVIYRVVFGAQAVDGVNYMQWVVPGVVVLNILSFGLVGSSAFMTDMREKGVLRRLQATPVPPLVLFGAYVTVNLISCLLQTALVIVFSMVVFQVPFSLSGLLLSLPMIFVAVLVAVALGQCISSLSPKPAVALAIGQLLYFAQMFVAGLILPVQMLPDWLQRITPVLPAYAIGELVRPPLMEGTLGPNTLAALITAVVYGGIAAIVAARFFRWEAKV